MTIRLQVEAHFLREFAVILNDENETAGFDSSSLNATKSTEEKDETLIVLAPGSVYLTCASTRQMQARFITGGWLLKFHLIKNML